MKNLFVANLKLGVRLCELVRNAIRIQKLSQTLSHTHTKCEIRIIEIYACEWQRHRNDDD